MTIARLLAVALLASGLCAAPALTAGTKKDFEEATSADGLQKISVRGIDLAYVRPGVSFKGYTKVMIDPVNVAFRKDFSPQRPGSYARLSTDELNGIRHDVGRIVQDEFAKELTKGAYVLVTAPGPDVLQVHPEIVDLYVNAPDPMAAGRSRSYTTSSGEMTLILTLLDSETGTVLARAYDRDEARGTGSFTLTTSITNRADAERTAGAWARILRARLDAARGISP